MEKCIFVRFSFRKKRRWWQSYREESDEEILTLGTLSALQTPSERSLSLISQAKMLGHSRLYSDIFPTTPGVATRGLDPPIALGLIDPVS